MCPLWLFQRKLTSMCITDAFQMKIRKHTDNGDLIAQFLADTIRGEYPDAKYHHKLEAAKMLTRYDSSEQPDRQESQFWGLIPTPEELATAKNTPSPSTGEGWDGGEGLVPSGHYVCEELGYGVAFGCFLPD